MNCPFCGASVADGISYCTACGRPLTAPPPPTTAGAPPGYAVSPAPSRAGPKVAVVVLVAVLVLAGIGIAAVALLNGGSELGACVEEWQYQGATRKENWTRAECDAFCNGPVNDGVHLACYFEPY